MDATDHKDIGETDDTSNNYVSSFEEKMNAKIELLSKKLRTSDNRILELEGKLAEKESKEVDDQMDHRWQSIGKIDRMSSVHAEDTEKGTHQLSQDVYTIISCSSCRSPAFWFANFIVFGIQYPMLIVLILDQVNYTKEENPLNLPANVEFPVRLSQFLAILIAVFTQSDLLVGIETFFEGRPVGFRGGAGSEVFQHMKGSQWHFSCLARFIQGSLSLIAAFLLIMQSDNVLDVLLNFLGMSFVSDLDDQAFNLAVNGYFGSTTKDTATTIENTEFYREKKGRKWIKRVAHIMASLFVLLGMVAGFFFLSSQQNAGVYSESDISVEFGDEALPYMGMYSGCYKAKDESSEFGENRLVYEQVGSEVDGGKFAFCGDFKAGEGGWGGWAFLIGELRDPCENYVLRSGETDTFDILDAADTKWYTVDELPLDFLEMGQVGNPDAECGRSKFTSSRAVCGRLRGGLAETTFDLLPVDNMLKDRDFLDPTQAHPVYYSKPNVQTGVSEIVLFTGRRWVMTDSSRIPGLNVTGNVTESDLQDYFFGDQGEFRPWDLSSGWVTLVTEAIEVAFDRGSPLGLVWYYPRYLEDMLVDFPSADTARPVVSLFSCAFCDDERNPCFYEGKCNDETGYCDCKHGASGPLCEEKPLKDGICNLFFNKMEFDYDGGDCCPGTCVGLNCGADDLPDTFNVEGHTDESFLELLEGRTYAFGINITDLLPQLDFTFRPIVYDHCIDPQMAKVTLVVDPDIPAENPIPGFSSDNSDLQFATLSVQCGGKAYFSVPAFSLTPGAKYEKDATFRQELHVPYGAICTISTANGVGTDSLPYSSMSLVGEDYDEPFTKLEVNARMFLDIDLRCVFDFRIPGSKCLWDTLVSESVSIRSINETSCGSHTVLPSSAITVERYEAMGSDAVLNDLCKAEPSQVLERYALRKLLDTTKNGASQTWDQHMCESVWNTKDYQFFCDENQHIGGIVALTPENGVGVPPEVKFFPFLQGLIIVNWDALLDKPELLGLPSEVFALKDLKMLGVYVVSNFTLSSEIGLLTNLQEFSLALADVEQLPTEISNLASLTSLMVQNNKLPSLPTEIGQLGALEYLDVSINAVEQIPTEIGNLSQLKVLNLEQNRLVNVPSEIGRLQSLVELKLQADTLRPEKLTALPTEIGQLQNLTYFGVQFQQIASLPSEVGEMQSLESLLVLNNRLTSLPSEIGKLTSLVELKVDNNELSSLPTELGNLSTLQVLNVAYNKDLLHNKTPALELLNLNLTYCWSEYYDVDAGYFRNDWCSYFFL